MASGDDSDYEVNFHSVDIEQGSSPDTTNEKTSAVTDVTGEVSKNVTAFMFQAGKERAKKVLNVYGNIDVLRPYFDVEPHQVRQRLIHSLIPQKPFADVKQRVPQELYGPLMVVFTLVALLLFEMKLADHSVREGTLMGSAFGMCFGYWFGVSSLVWVLAYVCNTHITILQLLSLIGYSLFGHCVVILIGTVFHTSHDHAMFYLLWLIFGGLSALKMVSVLVSRTHGQSQKLVICGTVVTLHLLFLLYLHFAYHQVVEDISAVLDEPVVPEVLKHKTQNLEKDVFKQDLHDISHKLIQQHSNNLTATNLKQPNNQLPHSNNAQINEGLQQIVRQSKQDGANNLTALAKGFIPKMAARIPDNNNNLRLKRFAGKLKNNFNETKVI